MKRKYRVKFHMDHNYEVISFDPDLDPWEDEEAYYASEEVEFVGDLADCEAYIRLHEGGYM